MKEFEIGFKTPESGGGNDIFFSDDDFSADSYGDMAEFTDEEVMARGEECTGNEHMDIIWEDFQPRMEAISPISRMGPTTMGIFMAAMSRELTLTSHGCIISTVTSEAI